jgi:membrane protein DedA with SNARE-associated domain
MNKKIKEVIKLLSIPLTLLIIYLTLFLIWKILSLPPPTEMINIVKNFFDKYGLIIIFISALIEGILLLGQYFPGGFIIFLGVISAGKNIPRAIEVVSIVSISFFIAYYLNYLMGKYGWHNLFLRFGLKNSIEKSKKRIKNHTFSAIFLGFWEPDIATITATAAGVLEINIKKFLIYSAFSIIFWNILWGTLVFSLGEKALKFTGIQYILPAIAVWICLILIRNFWIKKQVEV